MQLSRIYFKMPLVKYVVRMMVMHLRDATAVDIGDVAKNGGGSVYATKQRTTAS